MRIMLALSRLIFLTTLLLIGLWAAATPDRPRSSPAPPRPKAPEIPDISGDTRFGELAQSGREVRIEGHHWEAAGRILDDDTLFLLWTGKKGRVTGRVAVGHYQIGVDGSIVGEYVWSGDGYYDKESGRLVGFTNQETVRPSR